MTVRQGHPVVAVLAAVSMAAAISLQMARDRVYPREETARAEVLYIRSGEALKRIALGYDALLADVYWIRALQYYGGHHMNRWERVQTYELLYPLLDMSTTLDPYFNIAYRFGAIFLSEGYPEGPAKPEQAVALLRKGIANRPGRWQYYMDIGFVYYWHLRDNKAAAQWIQRAADQPGAPTWLPPLAATMLVEGNDRGSARVLWGQVARSEEEWLRRAADRALKQIDAMDQMDALDAAIARADLPAGTRYSWRMLVERRILRGVPLDPAGTPYDLDPGSGRVSVSRTSPLFPMPNQRARR